MFYSSALCSRLSRCLLRLWRQALVIAEGLPKQDRETFEDIRDYVDALVEHEDWLAAQPIDKSKLPEDVEIIEENGPKEAILREYRTCGDESCRCMSGGEIWPVIRL